MNPLYAVVAQRANHRCEYCHAPEVIFNCAFEVEHILPTSLGGGDDEANLALSCRVCNLRKSDRVLAIDVQTGTEVALFNPRKDRWQDNFTFDSDSGEILGLTPVGRATLSQLEMNSAMQVTARIQWIRLGIFP
jgi:hypothetical protein